MMPTTTEIARQLAIMVELYPDKTTSEIAHMLGYAPLFTINAIAEAKGMEYLSEDKKKDKLILLTTVDYKSALNLGDIDSRIREEIYKAIKQANRTQQDMSMDQLRYWLIGTPDSAVTIALHILIKSGVLHKYTLLDPKDVKSKYEFLTLAENKGCEWGSKQFKQFKKKKKK